MWRVAARISLYAQKTQRFIPPRVLKAVKQHLKNIVWDLSRETKSAVRKLKGIYVLQLMDVLVVELAFSAVFSLSVF